MRAGWLHCGRGQQRAGALRFGDRAEAAGWRVCGQEVPVVGVGAGGAAAMAARAAALGQVENAWGGWRGFALDVGCTGRAGRVVGR